MSKLKIAIQKSGRLYEDSLQLLKDCGIYVNNGKDQLKVLIDNFPMEIMYLRNSDIPQYLEDGVVDVAIVGENLLIEKQKNPDRTIAGLFQMPCFPCCSKDVETDDLAYFQEKNCHFLPQYPDKLFRKKRNTI